MSAAQSKSEQTQQKTPLMERPWVKLLASTALSGATVFLSGFVHAAGANAFHKLAQRKFKAGDNVTPFRKVA